MTEIGVFGSYLRSIAHRIGTAVPQKTTKSHPQAALIPYVSFHQRPAFKEEEMLAEFGRPSSRIVGQNADFTEAEVEADVATAVATHHDTLLRNVRPFAPGAAVEHQAIITANA